MHRRTNIKLNWALFLGLILLSSCTKEKVEKEYIPTNAFDEYIYSLKKANLQNTILFKKYLKSSTEALT